MPTLTIDGKILEVPEGITLIQACELAGVEIPRFCYHDKLKIAGNCRMCLVEVEKAPKPLASCATAASEGLVVHTNSEKVKKLREGVLELLLINHPLDCPVCDQGGECDLQDITYKYALGKSRYEENRRVVADKYMGPLIKTSMTRCIHCTRCIRFTSDIAGIDEIAAVGRGEHMEITSYLEQAIKTELSGNVIDLCPVGALVSKPYAYKARKWDLASTESIDVLDALGSNIRLDAKGAEIVRILPKLNEDINEEWISDKTRFAYDGLKNQRLDVPYVKINGKLKKATWNEAIDVITAKLSKINSANMAAIAGTLIDCESMFALKKLFNKLDCYNLDANQFNYQIDSKARANYLFNSTIAGIEKADLCILLGANPRFASPVLNARIGKMVRSGQMIVARIGAKTDQSYKIVELSTNPKAIESLVEGSHEFAAEIAKAKNPMIIIGDEVLARSDSKSIISKAYELVKKHPNFMQEGWNGFNLLHNHASFVGSLDVGFKPSNNSIATGQIMKAHNESKLELLYLLGADDIDIKINPGSFIIYQGHHGDIGASVADVILPSPAYTEKDATYVNLEGRPQRAYAALKPLGEAKVDFEIILNIAKNLNIDLGFDDLASLRKSMAEYNNIFAPENIGKIIASSLDLDAPDVIIDKDLLAPKRNYYMTDVISKSSSIMADCIKAQGSAA